MATGWKRTVSQRKHVALFTMALLTVLLYIVPLTLLTLFAPFLQSQTHHPVMRWVIRIKPLLDAYQGPYKDRYHYWTGVTLLVHLVLFVVFGANITGDPNTNTFTIVLFVIFMLAHQNYNANVYKDRINSILDCFYAINLGIFALATLFLNGLHKSSELLTAVMAGSAFIVFCFLITYHSYIHIKIIRETAIKFKNVIKMKLPQKDKAQHDDSPSNSTPPRQLQPPVSIINMQELREPLLD